MRFLASAGGVLAVAAALAAAVGGAVADEPRTVLCGAEGDGVRALAAAVGGPSGGAAGLAVTPVESAGAKDSLMKLAGGDCDAAIVPLDMLMLYKADHMAGPLMIAAPLYLYDRYLHLVCRRESGIEAIDDLLRGAERRTLLVGDAGSASAITWTALTKLDREYRGVATREMGGAEALAALTAGEEADCLLRMDGIGSAFMARVEAAAARLRLVPIDLFKLRDAEMVENRVYRAVVIPPGTYAQLQAGLADPAVETLAVGTMLVADRAWARADPKRHEALMRAARDARQSLLDGAGP